MAKYDDLPVRSIAVASVVSIAVTIVTILAVQVVYFGMLDYVTQSKLGMQVVSQAEEILEQQTAEINRYGVDPEQGRYTIPIDQAMKKVLGQATAGQDNDAEATDET